MLAAVGLFGLAPTLSQATVFTNVPEAALYRVAYELNIPDTTPGWATNPAALLAAYNINNTSTGANTIATGSFSRVGYYLELGGSVNPAAPNGFVYASFDANGFAVDASKLGVPNQVKFQQTVSNLNVVSNHPGITNVTGSASGNIEFWPSNYSQPNTNGVPGASNANFDNGDGGANTGAGHGSMQIFNGTQTLFGYNAWGNGPRDSELGIGNAPGVNTDWTFNSGNNDNYTIQKLTVVVDNTPTVAAAPAAPAPLVALCPELSNYQLIYQEALAGSGNQHGGVAYDVNNTALVQDGSFNRVAYVLELASTAPNNPTGFVCVSFDTAGLTTEADKLGIPTQASGEFFQQLINNLSVTSNVPGVINGDFAQGNIEFWSTNYGPANELGIPGANGGTFDFGDTDSAGAYGSMQIHNFLNGQTVFAYNNFGAAGSHDLGIGNNPSGNPDWTFRNNATGYSVKNMYVLIQPNAAPAIPEPASMALLGLGAVALASRRGRKV